MAIVELHMYDMSNGLASSSLSSVLVGKQFSGLWHTSIVVFGYEFYFGRDGILQHEPGTTEFGSPTEIEHLGLTYRDKEDFYSHLDLLKFRRFAVGTYSIRSHNCNTFSNELSKYLVDGVIPKHILDQPMDIIVGGVTRVCQVGVAVAAGYAMSRSLKKDEPKRKVDHVDKKSSGISALEIGGAIAGVTSAALLLSNLLSGNNKGHTNRFRSIDWDSDSD